jgi:type I restriction enzyme M protein
MGKGKKGEVSKSKSINPLISVQLKDIPEQQLVVGPLVQYLVDQGWELEQMIFGKKEWLVPKSPSQQTKREKGHSYLGFPTDIAVFDSTKTVGDPRHLLFLIECKQPNEQGGVSQLEAYFVGEPHVKLGIWANTAEPSAQGVFIYRKTDGGILLKRQHIKDLPRPGEAIKPGAQRITFNDLIAPTEQILRKVTEDLLDKVVIADNNVTRREEQLDQLCNILLLKLEGDKQGKASPDKPLFFRPMESAARTGEAIRERYKTFVELYPETFTTDQDKQLRFGNETIAACVEALSGLRLIDLGVSTVSVAFQVLRSEALKQGEGQYFTPSQVIQAGVRLLQIGFEDIVIDPACGTGGFLVETMLEMQRQNPEIPEMELSRWAQTHIYGIEKDAIGLKLTKAIMQIAGDGSAHCVRGDSIRVHNWTRDFPHLSDVKMRDGRFSVVMTNPPFGQNLKVSAEDSRLSSLDIAKRGGNTYTDLEIGLIFLNRAYQLLRIGGRVGIVLPETYFFSSNYSFLANWLKARLRPVVVANIPMEAFQGFCRAKTNFYVFEKIA